MSRHIAIWPVVVVSSMALGLPIASAQSLKGLSDNTDCAFAETVGVVASVQLNSRNREIEGFRFKDKYGVGYINVSLPEGMSKAKTASTQASLRKVIEAGAKLKLGVLGCGAAGRVEVLSSVFPMKG